MVNTYFAGRALRRWSVVLMASALAVPAVRGADWVTLVGAVDYSPDSLTVSTVKSKTGDREEVRVWLRFREPDLALKVEGVCATRAFYIVQVITDKNKSGGERGYASLPDEPGTDSAAAITALCKKARPWWKPW